MDRLVKYLLCSAVLLAVCSLLIIEPSHAQTIPKPSVPQFTINYVEQSYDIAPTYTIDPYTGQTEMTSRGNTVIVKNIEVVIQNQAFSPHQTADGNYTQLGYYVRAKGYYEQWITDSINEGGNIILYNNSMRTPASISDATILTIPLNYWNIKPGGEIDFQVKAVIANYYTVQSHDLYIPDYVGSDVISEGDWSSTQTLTIPSANSSPAPSPTVPEFPIAAILPLLALIPVILLLILRKNSSTRL
jgi:hypothetical protein